MYVFGSKLSALDGTQERGVLWAFQACEGDLMQDDNHEISVWLLSNKGEFLEDCLVGEQSPVYGHSGGDLVSDIEGEMSDESPLVCEDHVAADVALPGVLTFGAGVLMSEALMVILSFEIDVSMSATV